MQQGSLRNLDQIQETDTKASGARVGALVLASVAGACLVFAGFALIKRPQTDPQASVSPLDALVQNVAPQDKASVGGHQVGFPSMLSDEPNPTTAMAALGPGAQPAGSASGFVLPPGAPTAPPVAGDVLPVIPLPAQNYMAMSPVVAEPRDSLTALAATGAAPSGDIAEPGRPGGFQLQVSSFRTEKKALEFADRLRRSGHRAHVVPATVSSKGTWYRVRVGPFKNKWEAMRYRKEFEQREHIVTFLVEPDKKTTAFIAD